MTDRARAFDDAYSNRIVGFTKSGITLTDIPIWGEGINDFLECDDFINSVLGSFFDKCKELYGAVGVQGIGDPRGLRVTHNVERNVALGRCTSE